MPRIVYGSLWFLPARGVLFWSLPAAAVLVGKWAARSLDPEHLAGWRAWWLAVLAMLLVGCLGHIVYDYLWPHAVGV